MTYKPTGPALAYQFQDHALVLQVEQGVVVISTNVHGAIRVDLLKLGQRPAHSYALQSAFVPVPFLEVEELVEQQQLKLSLAWGYAVVQLAPQLAVSYYNTDGKLLLADDAALALGWLGDRPAHYKTLQSYERFVGLGEKTGPLDKWGRAYTHANTDAFAYGPDTDPIYASIPFYMGIHGGVLYGLFYDSTWVSEVNFGASNTRFSSFMAQGGPLTYYFLPGTTPMEVLQGYQHLTGYMPLPPRWALGLQQCRYSYYPDAAVLDVVKTYRRKGIPLDVIYLDIHYMDRYRVFTWHPDFFPDPAGLVKQLEALGVKVVVIMDPGISTAEDYAVAERLLAQGMTLQYPDGKPWVARVWPGECYFPDFTDEATRNWWAQEMQVLAQAGIAGFWNDMNEPASWGQAVPALVQFAMDDAEGEPHGMLEGRNVYGMQMSRATQQGHRQHYPDKRPFVLTRAAYAGSQRYAAIWTGDNTASDDHLLLGARLVANLGLAGMPFAGVDIGGFIGECDPMLFARWVQLGTFSPLMRIHGMINSRPGEPWAYGEQVEAIATNFIRLRYRLMPTIYAAMRDAATVGTPLVRSLVLEQPHHPLTYDHRYQNQYRFGQALLVCPGSPALPYLPAWLPPQAGGWYCFYTGKHYVADQELALPSPPEYMPVLAAAGSLCLTTKEQGQQVAQVGKTLQVHLYPGQDAAVFTTWFYDDAGDGYGYEQGQCYLSRITYDGANKHLVIGANMGTYATTYEELELVFHGLTAAQLAAPIFQVSVNDELIIAERSMWQPLGEVPHFDPLGWSPPAPSESVLVVKVKFGAAEVRW